MLGEIYLEGMFSCSVVSRQSLETTTLFGINKDGAATTDGELTEDVELTEEHVAGC